MSTTKVFDSLLVLQYQSGDKKAMELLVKRHHVKFCRLAFWYVKDADASKDVVQDCWGIIITKLHSLRDANTFECWAMRIVIRKSLDFLKSESSKRIKLKSYVLIPDAEESQAEKDIEIKKLNMAIAKLSESQKIVLRLFYVEDYSLNEIGEILQISIGTVKSRLFHAREKLKEILK